MESTGNFTLASRSRQHLPANPPSEMSSPSMSPMDKKKESSKDKRKEPFVMITAIIVLFESRFFIVCEFRGKHYWSMIRRKWIVSLYMTVILYVLPFKYLCPDQEPAKQRVFQRLPCLPSYIYNAPILVLVEDITYHLTVIIVWLLICFSGLIALLVYIYWNTAKLLKNHRMSPQTYQIHRIFMSALVIQLVIPFCTIIGPAITVLSSIITNYYNQGMINFAILSITLHGSVTTIAMLAVHKPYQLAIKEMFRNFSLQSTEVSRREMYANHVVRMQSATQ
ncbi:hypothetical protein GCK72_000163 [Caenorhabditis remanei]|uniref:Uncharacterized protein n=1 Tax=Caenorhabditis remanei TaxID=31234 RepID=A0A6A5HMG0_CAERE|nr:hypothetical protein GCK72_000163 [Caenorhabditis remanei]KAF1768351.1 hypothetical protein GCK72_000163 [Caenorhabditis remanei]